MRLSPFVFTKGGIPTEWTVYDMVYNLKLQSSDGGDWSSLTEYDEFSKFIINKISFKKYKKGSTENIFSFQKWTFCERSVTMLSTGCCHGDWNDLEC